MPASGPSRRKTLTASKPSSRNQVHALFGAVGKVGVAGVAGDALLLRPAQQLVDRPAEQLAFQVPERDVDRADRIAREPGAAVRRRTAPHHVPELLGRHGVLPDEQVREVAVHDLADRTGVVGEAEPVGAVLSGHHHRGAPPVGFQPSRRYSV